MGGAGAHGASILAPAAGRNLFFSNELRNLAPAIAGQQNGRPPVDVGPQVESSLFSRSAAGPRAAVR